MKVVYFGTAEFAVAPLRAVAEHVALVISQPDRHSGRGLRLQPSPVKVAALELGLPIETPERARDPSFEDLLRGLRPDVLLVAAYGQILSQSVLDCAVRGGINLHGSILPKYRGAAPIQRALLAGEQETGITLMQMDKGMDSGDIIEIIGTPIGVDETYGELQAKLSSMAAELAKKWLPQIATGDYPRTPQIHELATLAPKIEKSEGEINFELPGNSEYNRFRAFTPSPGAYFMSPDIPVRVLSCRLAEASSHPGTIVQTSPDLVVSLSQGALRLIELQPAGKKPMSGRDWANGMRLKTGMRIS